MRSIKRLIDAEIVRLTRRFLDHDRGQVALTFAVMLVPMLLGAGAAVDYSRASGVKAQMQAALDGAVLAGLNDNSSTAIATAFFNSSFTPRTTVTDTSSSFTANADGSFTGSAATNVSTAMLGIAHINTIHVTTTSVGKIAYTPSTKSYCVLALSADAKDALTMSGSASISAPNCFVQVNSNNTEAVNMSGSSQISSADNCFVGKYKVWSGTALSPSPDVACHSFSDPFAHVALPTIALCDYNKLSVSTATTLLPGTYCGGLTISSTTATFKPGLYIIKDGLLNASGGSVLTDNDSGVSFYLTGTGAGVTASGGSRFHFTAMSSGSLKGFVFFLDDSNNPAAKSDISGASELYFNGVMYFPGQLLNLSGGSGAYATAPFTSYIADTFTMSGSSTLVINADPTKTTVPIPTGIEGASTAGQLYLSN